MRLDAEQAVVLDGATTSGAVDLRSCRLKAIRIPSTWSGNITFTASPTSDGTFVAVKNQSGTTITLTVTAATLIVLTPFVLDGLPWAKVVAAGAQTGDQTLTLLTEPRT